MTNRKEKTYSFNEYLDTFYPFRTHEKETPFDPYSFGDKLAEKSQETIEQALRVNKNNRSKTTTNHSEQI